MKLAVIVLSKPSFLDPMLEEFLKKGVRGATILDSKGMAASLNSYNELKFIPSLRNLIGSEQKENKTVFLVAEDDQIEQIRAIADHVTGGLDNPNTGILFTVPVDFTAGLRS